jgi:hypothetical protein
MRAMGGARSDMEPWTSVRWALVMALRYNEVSRHAFVTGIASGQSVTGVMPSNRLPGSASLVTRALATKIVARDGSASLTCSYAR